MRVIASQSLTGPRFNMKMTSYQYRKSHCGDKTILRPSYLHNGISHTGKMTSLYWIRALIHSFMLTAKKAKKLCITVPFAGHQSPVDSPHKRWLLRKASPNYDFDFEIFYWGHRWPFITDIKRCIWYSALQISIKTVIHCINKHSKTVDG